MGSRGSLRIAALLLALACGSAAAEDLAPPTTVEELDERITQLHGEGRDPATAPALYVHLVENGEVVLSKGYGVADRETGAAPTADTVFRIGSISKTFLGLAALMLAEEGKLDLNAKLADIAPEVPLDNPYEAEAPVRLVHLLEHTSGWPDITLGEFALQMPQADLKEAATLHRPFKSRYAPGKYFSYANGGYAVAGYILEKAAGEPYEDYVRRRIFEPLGLESASFFLEDRYATQMAKGYLPDGSVAPYDHIRDWPAGSINITARDLIKFAVLLERRGVHEGVPLVSPGAIERMERSETTLASALGLGDGYGLGNGPVNGSKAIWRGHDGGIGTFVTSMGYLPGSGKAYVAFSASEDIDVDILRSTVFFLERDLPSPMPEEVAGDDAALKPFAGFYQDFPSRQPLLAVVESLSYQRVTLEDGRLVIAGEPRALTPEGLLRRIDRPYPSHALVSEPDGGRVLLSRLGAQRQAPLWEVASKAAVGALAVALVLITLVYMFVWAVGAALGRLKDRGGVAPRLLALIALALPLSIIAGFIATGSAGSWSVIGTLGNPTPFAQAIYWITIGWPIVGAITLVSGVFTGGLGMLQRTYVILVGLVVTGSALYAAQYGWIGQKTWAF